MPRKLSKPKLDKIKSIFEQKIKDITSKVRFDDELDFDGDEVDVVQSNLISQLQSQLSSREQETVRKLEQAIKNIDNGTFGMCDECEGQIPEKRLMALPGCTICVSCAERNETDARQFAV